MISFKVSISSSKYPNGILLEKYVSVQAAVDVTGYNIQYLRRILLSGKLEGIKIGQIWLIEMQSLELFLQHVESTSGRRCGLFSKRVYRCRRETVYSKRMEG